MENPSGINKTISENNTLLYYDSHIDEILNKILNNKYERLNHVANKNNFNYKKEIDILTSEFNYEISKLLNNLNKNYNNKNNIRCCGIIVYTKINDEYCYIVVQEKKDYKKGKWAFPKGSIEKNESFKQCAIRELKEETNINIKIRQLKKYINIKDTRFYHIYLNNIDVNKLKTDLLDVKLMNENEIYKLKENFLKKSFDALNNLKNIK